MMGFTINGPPTYGPTYTFGDNMSVVKNTSAPESVLRKKYNSICYHTVREAVATGEWSLPMNLELLTLPIF
jgi:hypothetical protein